MSKAGAHRAQGDPRLTHRGSTEPLLETGAARLLLRDVKRMTILPMVTSSLLLWPRRRLPVILLPVADVRLFCGRPFLPCGKQRGSWARCRCVGDVGNGPVGLALGSLQVGLRPVQPQFLSRRRSAQRIQHVIVLGYGERGVFLLDEVLDQVRGGSVVDCSVAVGQWHIGYRRSTVGGEHCPRTRA